MRNLKKVLALVLALVMSLSLVTIANAVDFSDAADIDYEEAVDVMSTIGVIDGIGNNKFDPDGTLTREQAAKLIAYMLMGTNAEKLGVDGTSFKDVAATRWSAPAIEYCATLGIIDGAGDGNFYPAGKLTGYAFAKMLLTAIGYDSEIEKFTGPSWTINVATIGMEVGLHKGLENMFGSAELSRQEAAQMALNAIKTPLVQYPSKGSTISVNGAVVEFGAQEAEYVTTTLAREQRISNQRLTNASSTTPNYTVEFGEKYFPLLRLVSESDDFERPSHTWVYENKELGTYVDYDLLVEKYTEGVSNKTLYDLLGRNNLEDYTFEYYVDGVAYPAANANTILSRTKNDFGFSDNGVLTQVFVDHDYDNGNGLIKITSIRTWLGQVSTAYNANREQATVNVFTYYDEAGNDTKTMPKVVGVTEVPNVVDLKEDEFVLVNMSGKDTGNTDLTKTGYAARNWNVVKISDVEIMTDSTLTAFSKGDDKDWTSDLTKALFSSVTTNGTKYDASATAAYSDEALDLYSQDRLTGKTYNIYMDQYGYAIGVDLYSGNDNYVFITGFDMNTSAISSSNADMGAIFVDGTMKTIKVNITDTNKNIRNTLAASDVDNSPDGKAYFEELKSGNYSSVDARATVNRWFTYTEVDGTYTLTPAVRMMTTAATEMTDGKVDKIKCSNVVLDRTVKSAADPSTFHPSAASNVRVYGNDDSVFLVAEVGDTDATAKVISGVEGVYTGVQNVEIDLYDAENRTADGGSATGDTYTGNFNGNPKAGMINVGTTGTDDTILFDNTYTVFDKNNYIIASVVLGETKGSSAHYVYTLTAAKNEKIQNGKYYWDFDAVVDGQKQTLTVESKFANTISDLRPGHVQEVRYNGDYVTNIKAVADGKIYSDPYTARVNTNIHEVYDVGHVSNGVDAGGNQVKDDKNTVVWDCNDSADGTTYATGYKYRVDVQDMKLEGRTLYLNRNIANGRQDFGLVMANQNTPTVLIQNEGGKNDVITEYADIKEAIAAMEDADHDPSNGFGFKGRITAVLDGQGRAKWVVITSDTTVPVSGAGTNRPTAVSFVSYGVVAAKTIKFSAPCTFTLEIMNYGYQYVGTFTTNAAGECVLPVVAGTTYRVNWGSNSTVIVG